MIDGLKFKVSANEIADHLTARAQVHRGRMDGVISQTEADKQKSENVARGLDFMATHLHDGDYSLTIQEVVGVGLINAAIAEDD